MKKSFHIGFGQTKTYQTEKTGRGQNNLVSKLFSIPHVLQQLAHFYQREFISIKFLTQIDAKEEFCLEIAGILAKNCRNWS